jgi:hypothetical protein
MDYTRTPTSLTILAREDDENELAILRTAEVVFVEGGLISIVPAESGPVAIQLLGQERAERAASALTTARARGE